MGRCHQNKLLIVVLMVVGVVVGLLLPLMVRLRDSCSLRLVSSWAVDNHIPAEFQARNKHGVTGDPCI